MYISFALCFLSVFSLAFTECNAPRYLQNVKMCREAQDDDS